VAFLAVYVREAHPTDGWRMASNDRAGIAIKQPTLFGEREEVAHQCCSRLAATVPMVIDGLDDRVGHLYSGMPDRLYVLDRNGRVAYQSGRGPFGFKPGEMEQSLAMLLLDQSEAPKPAAGSKNAAPASGPKGRLPVLSNEAAWKHLPAAEEGAGQPLPSWARALAAALPRTAAAMLELDYLHREKSPLGARLRGEMRWVAAHANRCAYGEAYALADLRRAGLDEAALRALTGDQAGLPADEAAALAFARKLTVAADTVTDAEVGRLVKAYGTKQVVAMVLLASYANFQDRLVLSLGLPVEVGGPLPPPHVRFVKEGKGAKPEVPVRLLRSERGDAPATRQGEEVAWSSADFEQLQKAMAEQKARPPRIPVPTWEEVKKRLAKPPERPVRIRWSLVCLGYQPELAQGWSACTRAFAEEAKQDRVFEESLFWVVTRTLNCFY
jgi:alkylhydroperoxidase family enzyme